MLGGRRLAVVEKGNGVWDIKWRLYGVGKIIIPGKLPLFDAILLDSCWIINFCLIARFILDVLIAVSTVTRKVTSTSLTLPTRLKTHRIPFFDTNHESSKLSCSL